MIDIGSFESAAVVYPACWRRPQSRGQYG